MVVFGAVVVVVLVGVVLWVHRHHVDIAVLKAGQAAAAAAVNKEVAGATAAVNAEVAKVSADLTPKP